MVSMGFILLRLYFNDGPHPGMDTADEEMGALAEVFDLELGARRKVIRVIWGLEGTLRHP